LFGNYCQACQQHLQHSLLLRVKRCRIQSKKDSNNCHWYILFNQFATRLSVHASIYKIPAVNQTLVHPTFTVNQTHFLSKPPTAPLNVSATAPQNISTTGLMHISCINPSSDTDSRSLLESGVSQGNNWSFKKKNPRWQFTTDRQMMRTEKIINYSTFSSFIYHQDKCAAINEWGYIETAKILRRHIKIIIISCSFNTQTFGCEPVSRIKKAKNFGF